MCGLNPIGWPPLPAGSRSGNVSSWSDGASSCAGGASSCSVWKFVWLSRLVPLRPCYVFIYLLICIFENFARNSIFRVGWVSHEGIGIYAITWNILLVTITTVLFPDSATVTIYCGLRFSVNNYLFFIYVKLFWLLKNSRNFYPRFILNYCYYDL